MPMPLWWGKVNKRVFNPRVLEKGTWPVLTHVGRTSGAVHRTPLGVHPADDGYLFVLVYGSGSDWVRNVLADGKARLTLEDKEIELVRPRIVDRAEAFPFLSDQDRRAPKMLRINEFLRVDVAP